MENNQFKKENFFMAIVYKIDVLKEHNIDIHVDDKIQNYRDAVREGIFCYLVTAPHNTYLDVGTRRIESLLDLKGIK